MMNKILLLISITFLLSCNAQKRNIKLSENYLSPEQPPEYQLHLQPDSTFVYKIGFNGNLIAQCKGKWTYIKKIDSIRLYCEEESALESLTSTYMSQRINSFKILKKGRIIKNEKITLTAQN